MGGRGHSRRVPSFVFGVGGLASSVGWKGSFTLRVAGKGQIRRLGTATPEQLARQQIDRVLAECGWIVQDYTEMNIAAARGVAVREFPLKTGFADYLLYADGRVIGVVEAKSEGHTLKGVETQSAKYLGGLPAGLPRWTPEGTALPFAYESTGTETQFTSNLDPEPRSREVFAFHRPEELIRLVQLKEQVRGNLRKMPELETSRLWDKQITAIGNLEKSLASDHPRSLIQMVMGAGKTFTACNIAYRLIKFGGAKRILFLVDRNNLGKQTLNEFQQFASPYNQYKFTEEFGVQQLRKNAIDPAAKVVITTIQRLYSILKGEEEFDESGEEASMFEAATSLVKQPLPVVYNEKIPPEFFDFIVIDECHRSIYNIWRQVLEYFDASLIGLTATPSAQTIGFFQNNLVMEYTHEQAVVDGVNVGYDVYRIETEVTKNGAKLTKDPAYLVPKRDRTTRKKRYAALDADVEYKGTQLDRDVVNPSQIRLVIETFRNRLPEIFPGREECPKTLVFAKTDQHADDITEIIRQVFGKGNEFCQKITSKSTGKKPEELLNEFRNSYFPRVAVTVDMIATGTDVKALECLLFMRNIASAAYFEQMKGRGCRVISSDALQAVTPDAPGGRKTHFVIVDAIGVTESEKTLSKPLDRQPTVPLEKLLNTVAAGAASPDIVSTLAARLARLDRSLDEGRKEEIGKESAGRGPAALAAELLASIDADLNAARAAEKYKIPKGQEPSEQQVEEVERGAMAAALKPFLNPKLRNTILRVKAAAEQVFDEVNHDQLIRAGFDAAALEKARSVVTSFKEFIEENKDEIEALRVLYSRPYRAGLRYGQVKELAQKLGVPPFYVDAKKPESVLRLWQAFEAAEGMASNTGKTGSLPPTPSLREGASRRGGRQLVDLIALVRHALDGKTALVPIDAVVEERYSAWLAEKAKSGITHAPEQRKWLDAIKDHIATSLAIDAEALEEVPFKQMGGLGAAYEVFGQSLTGILEEMNERLVA
ncbi:MAG: DEAD/DEAH box helicase family protein [Planctomycetes bacterium]|nr:DEAD/DEAH box helicase family protein [Planctomycetota bacterium]